MALIRHREQTPELVRDWPLPTLPGWRWFDELLRDVDGRQMIKVEEFAEGDDFVVRAELPGIDPDKDVEITFENGLLHITAERTEKEEHTERDFHRREMRYGSFARTLGLPEGVDETKIAATDKDGILEVRMPLPAAVKEPVHRVPVTQG